MTGIFEATYDCFAIEQITIDGTNQGLTVPAGAEIALIQADEDIRKLQNPTANTDLSSSVGIKIFAGKIFQVSGADDLRNLRMTQVTTGGACIVEYYKKRVG